MARYLLLYHAHAKTVPMSDPEEYAAWADFVDNTVGAHAIDPGRPIYAATTTVGATDENTRLCGYSLIDVGSLDEALAIAEQCPTLPANGGVTVAPISAVPSPPGGIG